MNKSQQIAIDNMRAYIERVDFHDSYTSDKISKYEFKRWEVTATDYGTLWVTSEVGLIGDEGTIAEALARTLRHIHIGKRGGLSTYADSKKIKGFDVYKVTG